LFLINPAYLLVLIRIGKETPCAMMRKGLSQPRKTALKEITARQRLKIETRDFPFQAKWKKNEQKALNE
jgi:hypothetical protein